MKMGDKLPPRTKYLNSGKLLTLSAVDERDGGKYMCTATNSAGEDVHYFDVIVEGKSTVGDNCGFICVVRLFFCFQAFDTVVVEVVFFFLTQLFITFPPSRATKVADRASSEPANYDWV